nr:hypothetical protein [Tanacetum cinerariifolium]
MKRKRNMNYTETSILIKEGSSSVSPQFVTSMLNPTPDAGMESIFKTTSQMDVQTPISVAPLPMSAPTLTSSTIATITTTQQALIPPTIAPSTLLQDLPNFGLLFRFDNRLKTLETSTSESATAEEPMLTTFEMEEPSHPEFDTGADDQPIVASSQHPEWFSQQRNHQLQIMIGIRLCWIPTKAFSHTLTLKLLAGPTYELMKGSCKSLVELEYQLEEVYKATTDQLDWVNPEGQQYPHNLLKPLPLIPYNRGHRVIPFDHFINNDLEYLRGGYDKHALWGISHWGRKRQLFYGFAVNRESAHDVYSKRKIIGVIELKIVEWHNYKHLDWITIRRDDDKLYKFEEGDFKRLHIQDIEDMCVEDLQLGVESYQKKLNLTKPNTYRSDLKCKEAYITYSNPRGFIYQNKDKQNRLMQIDELHKFSDGMLTDVPTTLDDRLKGIWMKYLPQSIWRKSDKDRATAMI